MFLGKNIPDRGNSSAELALAFSRTSKKAGGLEQSELGREQEELRTSISFCTRRRPLEGLSRGGV